MDKGIPIPVFENYAVNEEIFLLFLWREKLRSSKLTFILQLPKKSKYLEWPPQKNSRASW